MTPLARGHCASIPTSERTRESSEIFPSPCDRRRRRRRLLDRITRRDARRRAPRAVAGKPNLNGIWQALNTANYDILSHQAKAALAFRPGPVVPVPAAPVLAFGAVGAVPAGNGIVEGDEIPYLPEAAKKQKENQANWLDRDPEIKCYLPGVPRANYMSMPFQILHSDKAVFFAYEYAGAVRNILLKDPGPAPVDSWMGQSVGVWEGDTLRRHRHGLQRSVVVRSRRQSSQRQVEGRRALHAARPRSSLVRSDDRRSGDLQQAVEDAVPAVSAHQS